MEAFDVAADRERLEEALAQAIDSGVVADAVVATSLAEAARLWLVRDSAGPLIPKLPNSIAYDISLPIARMADYLSTVEKSVSPLLKQEPLWVFGHLGDGNLHLTVSLRDSADAAEVDRAVYEPLAGFGSVSAEHGIGVLKHGWLHASRGEAERALMRRLKQALDPHDILNRGRVI
jgi:FAD/FMN-containing dehydrogenase